METEFFKIKNIIYVNNNNDNKKIRYILRCDLYKQDKIVKKAIIVKCNTVQKFYINNKIIGKYNVEKDEVFGDVYNIKFANIYHNEKKEFIDYVFKEIGNQKITRKIIEDLYKQHGLNLLHKLNKNINLLDKYNFSDRVKETVKNKIMFIDNLGGYIFWINYYMDNMPIDVILNAFNDNKNLFMFEDNPYLFLKYGADVELLDKFYVEKNKSTRTSLLVKRFLDYRFEKFGDLCFDLDNLEIIVEYINSFNKNIVTKKEEVEEEINNDIFIKYNNCLYVKERYYTEMDISKNIKKRLKNKTGKKEEIKIDELTDEQNNALNNALNSNLSVLTGGPGTGKTFTVKKIIEYLYKNGKTVMALAPTAKAASKIEKIIDCKIDCMTIHRAFNINVSGQKNKFNNIKPDFLLIDESSMINSTIFRILLLHTNIKTKIIFIGDENQLPPIGGGQVFKYLCNCNLIVRTQLTKIFRQKNGNSIIENANKIKEGTTAEGLKRDKNFYIFENDKDIDKLATKCLELFTEQRNITINNILIICATKNSVKFINTFVQNKYNKSNTFIKIKDKVFKIGDKVIHTKNDKENEIYNGNIGYVKEIKNNKMTVDYKNNEIIYDKNNIGEVELAYAITIHKAQGSEAENVFVILDKDSKKMMNRNLIYTAVTRAKNTVCICAYNNLLDTALSKALKNYAKSNILKMLEN